MPTVQLSALSELWPNSRIIYIKGRGSFGFQTSTENMRYGRIVTNTQNTVILNYRHGDGAHPNISMINRYYVDRGVPDISIDQIFIQRMANIKGKETILQLLYGKETVHPQDYAKLVVDGIIPKQELYEIIKQTKETLRERGLSPESLKRIRYSGLVLYDIRPYSDLIYDAYAIYELLEPGMMFMQEIFKRWILWDYQLRRRI